MTGYKITRCPIFRRSGTSPSSILIMMIWKTVGSFSSVLILIVSMMLTNGCTKEYPIAEVIPARPVLNGYISAKYGVDLYFTRSITPADQDTFDIKISDAEVVLFNTLGDTIIIAEIETGHYVDTVFNIASNTRYTLVAEAEHYPKVIVEDLVVPDQLSMIDFSLDRSRLIDKALFVELQVGDPQLDNYWFWYRFTGKKQPRYTNLERTYLYDICQANNYTNSNQMVFSSLCAQDGVLDFSFESFYFPADTLPEMLQVELVVMDAAFGRHLQQLSELDDLNLAFSDPPAPISNTNSGLGYVAPLMVYDTTFILR